MINNFSGQAVETEKTETTYFLQRRVENSQK